MRYFVAPGEDRQLNTAVRRGLPGSYVELSDGVTHYELCGPDGAPLVVMAGGLTVPLSYWDSLAVALHGHGLRTLTYSAYGRGYSDRVVSRYDEGLFVRQLAELIDVIGGGQSHHLVGTSMGALVAMAYLGTSSGNTTATLTLAGPAGLSRLPALQKHLLGHDITTAAIARTIGRRILKQHLGHNVRDPQRAAELTAMVGEAYRYEGSLYGFFSTLRNFGLTDREQLYRRTGDREIPNLLIWGDHDDVTPISAFDQVVGLLRPESAHVIEDCGHMAPFERPAHVATHLAAFTAAHTERY